MVKRHALFILDRITPLSGALILLVFWYGVTLAAIVPAQILPTPVAVWRSFIALTASGQLAHDVGISLIRLVTGFVAGALAGIVFGLALGLSATVRGYAGPMFEALRQVPSIAFIPMFILLLGIEEAFKIVIIAQAVFFPVALAMAEAIKGIPPGYHDVARVYRIPAWPLVTRIMIPAVLPDLLTGMRVALSRGWVMLVVAELLAADNGLGQVMEKGRQMFRLDLVMLGVILTGLIGFALDRLFLLAETRLVRRRMS